MSKVNLMRRALLGAVASAGSLGFCSNCGAKSPKSPQKTPEYKPVAKEPLQATIRWMPHWISPRSLEIYAGKRR